VVSEPERSPQARQARWQRVRGLLRLITRRNFRTHTVEHTHVGALERLHLNIETSDDRDILSEGGVTSTGQKVATIKMFRTQIADQLANMALPASPIQYPQLMEGAAEVLFRQRLYKPRQVDVGILAGRVC
jgi:hypothetical protein